MANKTCVLNHAADNIRILAASMVEKAKSGHPGGAMGGADPFVKIRFSFAREAPTKNVFFSSKTFTKSCF